MATELLQALLQPLVKGEKFQKINKAAGLIKTSNVDEIIQKLKAAPGNFETFLKVADVFKHYPTALEILEHGTHREIQKVTKLPWVFQEASPLANPDFLTTDLFPRVSFISRKRIIKSLGRYLKDPSVADMIFKTIRSGYGLAAAFPLLQVCSEEFITAFLDGSSVVLTPELVLAITKRFPELVLQYLHQLYQSGDHSRAHYHSTINFLLDIYPKDALRIINAQLHYLDVQFGHTRSRKLLKSFPAECFELIVKNRHYFKMTQIKKRLTPEQYEEAFRRCAIPKHEYTCPYNMSRSALWPWFKYLSPTRRFQLLQAAYKTSFKKELLDCPQSISPSLLQFLPEESRSKVIKWKLENKDYHGHYYIYESEQTETFSTCKWLWTALKPISDSFPELTEKLDSELDPKNQAELSRLLVLTCIHHKDRESLDKALQILVETSRKVQRGGRQQLLSIMATAREQLGFGEVEWACFQDLYQLFQEKLEVAHNEPFQKLLQHLIAFKVGKNEPADKEIEDFIKIGASDSLIWYAFSIFNSGLGDAAQNKRLIETYILALEKIQGPSIVVGTDLKLVVKIIQDISGWNDTYGKEAGQTIHWTCYPFVRKRFFDLMSAKDLHPLPRHFCEIRYTVWYFKDYFNDAIKTCTSNELDHLLGCDILPPEVLQYSLKKHPEKIEENIPKIFQSILKATKLFPFGPYLRLASDFKSKLPNVAQSMSAGCIRVLEKAPPENDIELLEVLEKKRNALALLSVLLPPLEFLDLIPKYFPRTLKKYQVEDEDQPRDLTGDLAVKIFYIRNYLCYVAGALSKVVTNLPENEATTFLRAMPEEYPPSMKKYLLRLYFKISSLEGRTNFLENVWANEKHPYLRQQILVHIYDHIKNVPNLEVWEILKPAIESLTENDSIKSLDYIRYNTSIDPHLGDLTTKYFQTILATVKRLKLHHQYVILRISCNVSKIEPAFLEEVISEILFCEQYLKNYDRHDLMVNYILDHSITDLALQHRLIFLEAAIINLLNNFWDPKRPDEIKLLTAFFKRVSHQDVNKVHITRRRKILHHFVRSLEEFHDFDKTFRNKFYMELALLRLEQIERGGTPEDGLKLYGSAAASLIKSYVELHGEHILEVTDRILKDAWESLPTREGDILNIVDGLVTQEQGRLNLLTALALVPRRKPEPEEQDKVEIYERLLAFVEESKDPEVRRRSGSVFIDT